MCRKVLQRERRKTKQINYSRFGIELNVLADSWEKHKYKRYVKYCTVTVFGRTVNIVVTSFIIVRLKLEYF